MVLSDRVGFSRRDVLVGLLGASWAGCRRAGPRPELEGGFVETVSPALAHRIREPPAAWPSEHTEIPVLILGAGIAGLSAAWWLRRRGFDRFQVLELGAAPGGTSASGTRDGLEFPWGAHYLPAPGASQPELLDLLQEFGTVVGRSPAGAIEFSETELCASPKERVFFRGIWHEGLYPRAGARREDLEQLARFEREIDALIAARDREGRRAFALPLAACSDAAEFRRLDELSMADWMEERGFTSPRLAWFVDYACRDDFGLRASESSAWAALHYFAARTEAPGDDSAEFLTWPAGNGELVRRLVRAVGPERIATEQLVAALRPDGDGRRTRVLVYDARRGQTASIIAERVIYALPSFTRRHLLSGFDDAPEYHPPYAPWLVANLHLSDRPRSVGFPTAWDNVIYDSQSLGYVVSTHQTLAERGPTVWTYYLPLVEPSAREARRRLEVLSWAEASDAVVSELTRCHPDLRDHLRRVDLLKWGHGMARPEVGTLFGGRREAAARPLGTVHFAHSDLSGLGLFEEAFSHGTRAAREVFGALHP